MIVQANRDQQIAINQVQGAVLIIAGPGSGKTFTLVERIINLIQNYRVQPENILVVTFTEKAAMELRTRISNRLLELNISFNINEMYLGTFHSICLRIIEDNREFTRLKRSFILMDQFDQQYFLYQKLRSFHDIDNVHFILGMLDTTSAWRQSENLVKWVNKVSEEVLPVDELCDSGDEALTALGECYKRYSELLEEHNSLDFSTIQVEALNLLQKNPQVLEKMQEQLEYLMVDEYQDTNTIQEKILFLLMGGKKNICVVGDDDQALYRFRGATVRNILQFPDNFSGNACKKVELTTNYRSHPDIIRFYNYWMNDHIWEINEQSYRYQKRIEAPDIQFPNCSTTVKAIAEEHEDWHDEIYALLTHLSETGKLKDWNQVAFLFQSVKNDKVQALAASLEEKGIPVYSPRANLFFSRIEVRLLIGALISIFPSYLADCDKLKAEGRNMGIWDYYNDECVSPFINEVQQPENESLYLWCKQKVTNHLSMIRNTDYAFSALFYELLQFPLFSQFLDGSSENARAERNVATISKLLAKFEYLHHISVLNPEYLDKNLRSLFNQFMRFLFDGGVDEYEDLNEYAPKGCVSFLTIHQSKGLEFPVVIVDSLYSIPRKQYSDIDVSLQSYHEKVPFEPIESTKFFDFWRLYYTAFSRAQNLLVLAAQEKSGHGKTPSKYFDSYVHELPSWKSVAQDIAQLDFEVIKDVNIKKEYAFTSHITLFENCSQQYRFFKELEFQPVRASPMLFGTLVHATLEDVHKAALRGETTSITKENIESWFYENYRNLSKRERVYLADSTQVAALNHVMRYVDRKQGNWSDIQDTEVEISLVKDNYILKGNVDLIRGDDNSVEIIDFKSEKKPDLFSEKNRLDLYQSQLEIYAHLVEKKTGRKVSKMHLYYTGEINSVPTISFDKKDTSIEATINRFDSIVERIENHDFSLKDRPSAKLCSECDIRYHCDEKNWI